MHQRRPTLVVLLSAIGLGIGPARAAGHVDYVTDPVDDGSGTVEFATSILSDPVNLALFVVPATLLLAGVAAYLRYRPRVRDVAILRETLASYDDLVPWMVRLSMGLPLVGAGFQGYRFAPTIGFDPAANPLLRVALIGLGFLLLVGLAVRVVATVGLVAYLLVLVDAPAVLIAFEYVPGLLALVLLGGGRPSADDILQAVASAEGTLYGRVDPVHHVKRWLDDATAPYRRYVPTILRVGVGLTFVWLGMVEKLGDPARSLAVVAKYDLTAVVPVDPGVWVLGAALMEVALGLALVVGLLTRASAATAFFVFILTLFGLPDDPVLAHVTLFGLVSAVFTMGAGPLSLDARLAEDAGERIGVAPAAD